MKAKGLAQDAAHEDGSQHDHDVPRAEGHLEPYQQSQQSQAIEHGLAHPLRQT